MISNTMSETLQICVMQFGCQIYLFKMLAHWYMLTTSYELEKSDFNTDSFTKIYISKRDHSEKTGSLCITKTVSFMAEC